MWLYERESAMAYEALAIFVVVVSAMIGYIRVHTACLTLMRLISKRLAA